MTTILHVSDVHCNIELLESIVDAERDSIDFMVYTGDLCCDGKAIKVFRSLGKPVYAVTGNMDDLYIARLLRDNGFLIDGRIVENQDFVIAGIGGLQPVQDVERVSRLLRERGSPRNLLVVAHHPIHGYLDITWSGVHAGLYETRRFVEEFKPLVYMHGHIHEARGVDRFGETLLVNAGPAKLGYYAIVYIEGKEARAELKHLAP